MQNKSFFWVVLGLIVFGSLTVFTYRKINNPTTTMEKDVVYGFVSLPETISELAVESRNNIITVKLNNGIGRLPVGKYYSRLWKIERNDNQGDRWSLSGQIFDNQGYFEVHDGNQTKLNLGEPIVATVGTRKSGSIYSFNQIIKGRLDEYIELTRNGARPRAPKLNIKNYDGTYNRTFSFEYG